MADPSFISSTNSWQRAGSPLSYSVLSGELLERSAQDAAPADAGGAESKRHPVDRDRPSFGEIIGAVVTFFVAFMMIAGFGMAIRPLVSNGLPAFLCQSVLAIQAAEFRTVIIHPPAMAAALPRQS